MVKLDIKNMYNHGFNLVLRVHSVAICDDASTFHEHAQRTFDSVGLKAKSEDILDIIEGYKGEGYGIASEEDYGE